MFCKRCDLPHGKHNKIEGINHLLAIQKQGRIGNLEVQKFSIIEGRDALREFILSNDRAEPVLVRTSVKEGDENYEGWSAQPRRKFPAHWDVSKKLMEMKLENFFKLHEEYDRLPKKAGERQALAYQVLKLPDLYYTEFVEWTLVHGTRGFSVICGLPFRRTHAREDFTYSADTVLLGHVSRAGSSYSVDFLDKNVYFNALMAHETDFMKPGIDRIAGAIPELMGEFQEGVTRLRMAVYEGKEKPVAFDWLMVDGLIGL